ncbi:MAG TPA: MBL fold metallo-hydrolase [Stellaceae bacterium]|nr:MBL fold metallo-hydrolase [Stellaceae bacterium]
MRSATAAGCMPEVASRPSGRSLFIPASFIADAPEQVSITFLGHASFLIESPQHVTAVTDYNGYNIPADPPDIATMNHAHSTHYTNNPDPRIKYVLHGWSETAEPAHIDLTYRDMHVGNLPTNIRDRARGGTEINGNSIFLFQTAGLCIAHLSHLHHLLTAEDLAALGQIDIVMAPVDGEWTMSHADMAAVLDQLHAPLVIPMHYFNRSVLEPFLALVRDRYTIRLSEERDVVISRATLPAQPEILVLPGG